MSNHEIADADGQPLPRLIAGLSAVMMESVAIQDALADGLSAVVAQSGNDAMRHMQAFDRLRQRHAAVAGLLASLAAGLRGKDGELAVDMMVDALPLSELRLPLLTALGREAPLPAAAGDEVELF